MQARTFDGREVDLAPDALDRLRTQIRGPIVVPGDSMYQECRTLWNGMIDRHPIAVVRCLGTTDVVRCIQFAREHDLLLCVKCGGHNIAGLAAADGALMLDLGLMRGVWIDHRRSVAHAQSGCLLGDVDRETQLHGLATVLGFVSNTGISGLTLGGGFGYLTRRWGYTSDNVTGIDLVTAEGRVVHATDDDNADLFWALRGGGGNFGVVTNIDYALHRVGPEIVGGPVAWLARDAAAVLDLYRDLTAGAPRELTLACILRPAPPAPWLPADVHGKPIIMLLACYSGDPKEGEWLVNEIKRFGRPVGDALIRRPYVQMQSLLDATQPKGRRYYWKSEYLSAITPPFLEHVVSHAAKIPSPHSAIILFHLDGVLNERDINHSAVGNRDARFVLNIAGSWERSADDETNLAWARNAWTDMKSFSTGGTYINFLTEDEPPDRILSALGKSVDRLARIKAKWDPENVFRTNRNIRPATPAAQSPEAALTTA